MRRRNLIGAVVWADIAAAVACATAVAVAAGGGIAGCACEERIGIDGNADTGGPDSWDPPIENLGEPGWADSTEPLCTGLSASFQALDVWSDPRGVFFIKADDVDIPELGWRTMHHLFYNDGSGWSLFLEEALDTDNFTIKNPMGYRNGTIFGWGDGSDMYNYWEIEGGTATRGTEFCVSDVFVVEPGLAYACTTVGLLRHDGSTWTRIDPTLDCPDSAHLWASRDRVFAAGEEGIVYTLEGVEWVAHEMGTFRNMSAIWGFGDDDVWAGTSWPGVLFHFDGTAWSEIPWTSSRPEGADGIDGMWGADGILYAHTYQELIQWDGAAARTIGYWPTSGTSTIGINAVWGNSPTEVFVAVRDEDHAVAGCGEEFLLWWDGAEFHWF